jgi:hypothetical protein
LIIVLPEKAVYDEGNNMNFIEYLGSIEHYDIIVVDSVEKSKEIVYDGDVVATIIIP